MEDDITPEGETNGRKGTKTNNETDEEGCCGCGETSGIFMRHVVFRSLRLFLYCLDISSDIAVAVGDYREGQETFAYVTLGLVFAPGILLSFYMLCDSTWKFAGELACLKGILWILCGPLLPAWPILRDLRLILMGTIATLSPNRRKKLLTKLNQPSKAHLLKFLEAFTEAAPQLVVRLLKLCLNNPRQFSDLRTSEIIQMCLSFLTLALTVVSTHQKNVSTDQVIEGKLEREPKYHLPCLSQIFALLWWLCFLLARLQALALFGATFTYWIFLVVGIHIALMFLLQTIASPKDRLQRIFIYLFGAFVFIFAYVQFNLTSKVKVGAWVSYTLFSLLVFIENTIMLICWLYSQNQLLDSGYILPMVNQTSNSGETIITSNNGNMMSIDTGNTANSSLIIEVPFTEKQLRDHWEILLFIHYGAFSAALVFMILTFFCSSFKNRENEAEHSNEPGGVEMQKLTK